MKNALDQLSILIVDPNSHIRQLLRMMLHAEGIETIDALKDAMRGFETFCDGAHDIVFTELTMNPMSGLDLVDLIRKSPNSPNPYVPIIMLSAHSAGQRVKLARDHGVTEFIAKPFSANVVLEHLNAVIGKPRPFIRVRSYFGPDRRRTPASIYSGPDRRKTMLEQVTLSKRAIAESRRRLVAE